jgi:hypothetical protein
MAAFHLIIYGRFWVITEENPSKTAMFETLRLTVYEPGWLSRWDTRS